MTSNFLTEGMLKVHVHPALVNTRLGCEMIAIDRFVDESTGKNPARQHWSEEVGTQLALYNTAAQMLAFKGGIQQWLSDHEGKPMGAAIAKARAVAFPTGWNAADPRQSIFAYDSARFAGAILTAVRQCPVASEVAYWNCVNDHAGGAQVSDQPFQLWSGVRETNFRLDGTAVADQARSSLVADRTDPLRFMFQVAFEQSEQHPVAPWEFPVLGSQDSGRRHSPCCN